MIDSELSVLLTMTMTMIIIIIIIFTLKIIINDPEFRNYTDNLLCHFKYLYDQCGRTNIIESFLR